MPTKKEGIFLKYYNFLLTNPKIVGIVLSLDVNHIKNKRIFNFIKFKEWIGRPK